MTEFCTESSALSDCPWVFSWMIVLSYCFALCFMCCILCLTINYNYVSCIALFTRVDCWWLQHSTGQWTVHEDHIMKVASTCYYFARGSGGEVLWWARLSVCVCLSVREDISGTMHARSLPSFLCMLPMTVARSSSGRMTKFQWEGAMGVFFHIDIAL